MPGLIAELACVTVHHRAEAEDYGQKLKFLGSGRPRIHETPQSLRMNRLVGYLRRLSWRVARGVARYGFVETGMSVCVGRWFTRSIRAMEVRWWAI